MRHKLLIGLLAGAFAAGYSPEPTFEGRPASYWVTQLKSKDGITRSRAVFYVSSSRYAVSSVPDFIIMLNDDHPVARYEAIGALIRLGPAAKAAVPALLELVKKDDNWRIRSRATEALKTIDPDAAAKAGLQ
jgi:HEAT repeat protein